MRILPVITSCTRDADLARLAIKCLHNLGDPLLLKPVVSFGPDQGDLGGGGPPPEMAPFFDRHSVQYRRPPGFGNGGNWGGAMIKLELIRQISSGGRLGPYDVAVFMDSDTLFLSSEAFDAIDGDADIYGLAQFGGTPTTRFGRWGGHLSGQCVMIRASLVKKMAALTEETLAEVRREFTRDGLTPAEDVVTGYLASVCGGRVRDLGMRMAGSEAGLEDVIEPKAVRPAWVHLSGQYDLVRGVPVTGKWDVPRALRQLGVGPETRWKDPAPDA